MKRRLANWLGVCGTAIIAAFWCCVLNPFGLQGFPNDTIISEIAVLLALVGSVIAFFKGSRWWSLTVLASLLTFVAIQYALR